MRAHIRCVYASCKSRWRWPAVRHCTPSLFFGSRTLQVPGVTPPHWLLVSASPISSIVFFATRDTHLGLDNMTNSGRLATMPHHGMPNPCLLLLLTVPSTGRPRDKRSSSASAPAFQHGSFKARIPGTSLASSGPGYLAPPPHIDAGVVASSTMHSGSTRSSPERSVDSVSFWEGCHLDPDPTML